MLGSSRSWQSTISESLRKDPSQPRSGRPPGGGARVTEFTSMNPATDNLSSTNTDGRHDRRDPIVLVLLLTLAAGLFLRLNIGLADNGDYTRAMGWITSGPATIQENWPPANSEQFNRRFYHYWIPYWKLDWPGKPQVLTSTALLWAPGAFLNSVFYSPRVLCLPVMSLVPRFALILLAVVAIRWIGQCGSGFVFCTIVKLLLGVPLVLILMATDYVRFFNTFYRETGTLVFLLWFLAGLVMLARTRHPGRAYLACGIALLLLTTAKVSNVYWPLVALPLLFLAPHKRRSRARALGVFLVSAAVAAAAFPFAEVRWMRENDAFLSLYSGVLTFSNHPAEHLARLGVRDTVGMVGQSSFTPGPAAWLRAHPGKLSHLAALNVILHEPVVEIRAMRSAAAAMQDIFAPTAALGERAEGDPTPRARWLPQELWSRLKASAFPRGDALFVALVVCAVVFIGGLRGSGFVRELSLVGLAVSVACPIDMAVQVFGAGTNDLARHLLIANFLFDLAVVALMGVSAMSIVRLITRTRKTREVATVHGRQCGPNR